jgi:hypothetical protein
LRLRQVRGDLEAAGKRLPTEELRVRTQAKVTQLLDTTNLVYRGYVDDHRNTDNAWIESTAMLFHCDTELGASPELDQAPSSACTWIDVSPLFVLHTT